MKTKFEAELVTWTQILNDKGKQKLEFADQPLTLAALDGDSLGYISMKIGDKEFVLQAAELIRATEMLSAAIKYSR